MTNLISDDAMRRTQLLRVLSLLSPNLPVVAVNADNEVIPFSRITGSDELLVTELIDLLAQSGHHPDCDCRFGWRSRDLRHLTYPTAVSVAPYGDDGKVHCLIHVQRVCTHDKPFELPDGSSIQENQR